MNDHPEIPEGYYCYRSLEVIPDPNGSPPKIKTEMCPHWHKTEKGARCDLINEEHTKMCMFHLLWDEVKACSYNKYKPGQQPPSKMNTDGWVSKEIMCDCDKTVEILVKLKNK